MMILPIELAKWQWGYIILAIYSSCFLLITMMQIIAQKEPKYVSVVKYGCIVMCAGIASILFNFDIVKIPLNSFGGGLLSQTMAFAFMCLMFIWAVLIFIASLYFSKKIGIFDTNSALQIIIVILPIIIIMGVITICTNVDSKLESTALLRESIFGLIPLVTIISCAISMFARKIVER